MNNIVEIKNDNLRLNIFEIGLIIKALWVKDKNGKEVNVVLGYDSYEDYVGKSFRIGATIGRVAGRTSKGKINIDNVEYPLYTDNKGVHLHGGKEGFDKKKWDIILQEKHKIIYQLQSPHLDEGYPGTLTVQTLFELKDNTLVIEYTATTNKKTTVNITNHSYFNLNGEHTILDHELFINADNFLEFDENLLPTGKILSIDNTPLDYRKASIIEKQKKFTAIDNCFVLKNKNNNNVGYLYSEKTGIEMSVWTNQPAAVIFTAPKIEYQFANGAQFNDYPAICFECQNYSDAINQKNFPSPLLDVNDKYVNRTEFKFLIE